MDQYHLFTITSALLCLPIIVISFCNDPNCALCNGGGNICDECKKGFGVDGTNCSPCPTNCSTCAANGYCQSCSPGFWGYQCLLTCPDNCNEAGCEIISGECFKCETGWYGPQCQQDCNRCENEQCDLHKCNTGCKDGYFEDIYNNVSYCLPCVTVCKICRNATFCTQCSSGHYIYKYLFEAGIVTTCLSCSSLIPKCVDCTYDQNIAFCRSCEAGYIVNQDNQCVKTVSCPHCQNGCDSWGVCFGGCQPGWTGQMCDYMCNYVCETCLNQDICLSCKDGFYTITCTVSCNTNCESGNYPRCRFVDGYCSNGCNKGFWGDQCENNCNNNCLDITTASELCHRNGTCYYGCKSGYMGSNCSQVSSVSTSQISITTTIRTSTAKIEDVTTSGATSLTQTQTKADINATEANLQTVSDCCINCRGSPGPAIGGSIAGGFVLGALAAAVVFYLRQRNLQKQKDQTQSKNMYYNVSMAASHEEQSQSERQLDRHDIEFASSSRQCEATLYEKLSEQNKGNIYDHLDQPSKNEIKQDVGELRSNVEYYNN